VPLEWREYTWREVADQVRRIASFLKSKIYPAGIRKAIWSSNSKDWPIVDLAMSSLSSTPPAPPEICPVGSTSLRLKEIWRQGQRAHRAVIS